MAIQKITASVLANNAVTAANVAAGALSAADIADNSITAAKISASTSPTFGDITAQTGGLTVGISDTTGGVITVHGNGTGNAEGGEIRLQTSADYDSTYDFYRIDVVEDDFRIGRAGQTDLTINSLGNAVFGGNISSGRITTSDGIADTGQAGSATIFNESGSTADFRIESDTKPYMFFLDGGLNRIGINTGTPTHTLHILNEVSSDTIDETNGLVKMQSSGGNGMIFGTIASSPYTSYIQSAYVVDTSLAQYNLALNPVGGKVGIGTDSPSTKLHIAGPTSSHTTLRIQSTSTGYDPTIVFSSPTNGSGIYLDDNDTNKLKFYTGYGKGVAGKEITIDNEAQLGIGTTSPNAKLEIKGASSTNYLQFNNSSDTEQFRIDSNFNWAWGTTTPSQAFDMRNNSGNALFAVDRSNGRVGIGTTSPAVSLDIGSKTDAIRVPNGTTAQRPTGAAGHIRYNTTTDKYEVYDYGASEWVDLKTNPSISFVNPTTYFTTRFAISADGQSADADNSSGYGVVSTNINFEGNFTLITKWAHDYMGIGIAYKAGITNSNFTGESADNAGPYGGGANVDGFDSTVSYMGQYHWPVTNGGNDDHLTTWYIKHQRSGNTISTHYSTNSSSADDPAHSSWTQVQSATISSSDHCKPVWGEASANENQILTFTYKDVTGGYNFS